MDLNSKKVSLVILGITSVIFSRVMFLFFNDPEGPNLLVVMVGAAIIYAATLALYFFCSPIKQDGPKKLLLLILAQIILLTVLYFCLK